MHIHEYLLDLIESIAIFVYIYAITVYTIRCDVILQRAYNCLVLVDRLSVIKITLAGFAQIYHSYNITQDLVLTVTGQAVVFTCCC